MQNKTKILTFLLFLAAMPLLTNAQCIKENPSFQVGEKIHYQAYYNWGVLWVKGGIVDFEVKNARYRGQEVIHLRAFGRTYREYDWLYRVRDLFQSYIDPATMKPLWYEQKTNEGKREVHNVYEYNHQKKQVYTQTESSEAPLQHDTLALTHCSYDLITMVYSARNIDFSGHAIGDTIPISMIVNNQVHHTYIRYLGRENITTRNNRTFRTIKFSPNLMPGTLFKSGEDMTVYITDDANRMPILITAEILLGSVKAMLIDFENLRYPMASEIKT